MNPAKAPRRHSCIAFGPLPVHTRQDSGVDSHTSRFSHVWTNRGGEGYRAPELRAGNRWPSVTRLSARFENRRKPRSCASISSCLTNSVPRFPARRLPRCRDTEPCSPISYDRI